MTTIDSIRRVEWLSSDVPTNTTYITTVPLIVKKDGLNSMKSLRLKLNANIKSL